MKREKKLSPFRRLREWFLVEDANKQPESRDIQEALDKGHLVHGLGNIHIGMTEQEINRAMSDANRHEMFHKEIKHPPRYRRNQTPSTLIYTEIAGVKLHLDVIYRQGAAPKAGDLPSAVSTAEKIQLSNFNTHSPGKTYREWLTINIAMAEQLNKKRSDITAPVQDINYPYSKERSQGEDWGATIYKANDGSNRQVTIGYNCEEPKRNSLFIIIEALSPPRSTQVVEEIADKLAHEPSAKLILSI